MVGLSFSQELATEFGVSRGPIREALRQLMQQILNQMTQLDCEAYREVFELDNRFHEQIMDLVPFKRLKKAWEDLSYGNIVIGYNMFVNRKDVTEIQYRIHEKLLKVCQSGNLEEIIQAILDHYLYGLEKLIRKMKEESGQKTAPDTQESA